MTGFEKLLEPGQIGSVRTRNRLVKSAASMCYWHEDDTRMSEQAKAYYGSLARGGVGLLVIESPDVDYPHATRWHEPSDVIGTGVIDFRLGPLLEWFGKKGVGLYPNASDILVTRTGVRFALPDGSTGEIAADTVIPTAPVAADTTLADQLKGRVPQVFAAGDCRESGLMVDAVAAAWEAARAV